MLPKYFSSTLYWTSSNIFICTAYPSSRWLNSNQLPNRYQKEGEQIEVVFESGQRHMSGTLIGKNTDYIFIEDKAKVIKAIPVSSDVQEIIIRRP